MKRRLSNPIGFFLLLLILITATQTISATEINGINYDLSGNTAAVISKTPNYEGDIVIPATVEYEGKTYSVTKIDVGAFTKCAGLTSVSIPETVTKLSNYAFYEVVVSL